MKLGMRVNGAAASAIAALAIGGEYALNRLGYATTLFPFIPASWRSAMQTEPYLIYGVGLLLALAIGLLWSVARQTAKAMVDYRSSNDRAWEFNDQFNALRDDYAKIIQDYVDVREGNASLHRKIDETLEKLDRLETERERSVAELAKANEKILWDEAGKAAAQIDRRIMQHRDRTAADAAIAIAEARQQFTQQLGDLHRAIAQLRGIQ